MIGNLQILQFSSGSIVQDTQTRYTITEEELRNDTFQTHQLTQVDSTVGIVRTVTVLLHCKTLVLAVDKTLETTRE